MPVEVVSFLLSGDSRYKKLQSQIILQCAPFLKGIKVACIINVERKLCGQLAVVLAGTDICYRILTTNGGRCLVFFYRKAEFAEYLDQEEVKDFLYQYGYEESDTNYMLSRLSERVRACSKKEIQFPHEIGAFLDYPLEDVRGFIEHGGQKSLLSGYWKVYNNIAKAQLMFRAYDRAKQCAVNEFLTGKTMKEIAV